MQDSYTTPRLALHVLTTHDSDFIFELVNTAEWIRFIGDRNVKTKDEAVTYAQQIIDNPNSTYWVVKSKESKEPMGIVTLLKRDYLDHPDFGFAFLPQHTKKGYAIEACKVVLSELMADPSLSPLLATTKAENKNSIKLLQKIGFLFVEEININHEKMLLYSVQIDGYE